MSRLLVAPVERPRAPSLDTTDPERITSWLDGQGVCFERWTTSVPLPPDATQDHVLAAYHATLARVQRRGSYPSVDVVRMHPSDEPGWPERARAAREKFLEEHTHAEDEIRFFVDGAGSFYLRFDDRVAMVRCERGDLLMVPAGTRHWFDMGARPSFCAIRFFGTPDGWKAAFTGDPIARSFPTFDELSGGGA